MIMPKNKNLAQSYLYEVGSQRLLDQGSSPTVLEPTMVRRAGVVEVARRSARRAAGAALVALTLGTGFALVGSAIDRSDTMRLAERTQQDAAGRDLPGVEPYHQPSTQNAVAAPSDRK